MRPAFSVSVGGISITGNLVDRLLSLEVTDQEGSQSDTCRILVDDRNGILGVPKRGSVISVAMGYRETGLSFMGLFTVDTVTLSGWPQQMEITGKSMDFIKLMKEQRSKGFEKKTVGDVCGEIAGRHGLANGCTGTMAALKYEYLGITEESDAHFLQALADKHDGVFSIKNGQLILKKKAENILGFAIVTRPGNVMDYQFSFTDRNAHAGGEADWWDRKEAKRQRSKKYGKTGGGRTPSPAKSRVPTLETNGKAIADDVAQSRINALNRAEKKLSMTVVGSQSIRAEMILLVVGVRGVVDGAYRIKSAVHSLTQDGYKTNIEAEGLA
jgi:phage protein D